MDSVSYRLALHFFISVTSSPPTWPRETNFLAASVCLLDFCVAVLGLRKIGLETRTRAELVISVETPIVFSFRSSAQVQCARRLYPLRTYFDLSLARTTCFSSVSFLLCHRKITPLNKVIAYDPRRTVSSSFPRSRCISHRTATHQGRQSSG